MHFVLLSNTCILASVGVLFFVDLLSFWFFSWVSLEFIFKKILSLHFEHDLRRLKLIRESFKKRCGIFHTFQNPTTPLAKCEKKIKIWWSSKNYFFPLKKSKILRKISRSGRSRSRLDLRNILSVRPPPILKKISCF